MKSQRGLLFSSFQGGKLKAPDSGGRQPPKPPMVALGLALCVVITGVSIYVLSGSSEPDAPTPKLAVVAPAGSPESPQGAARRSKEPEIFWSVRVETIGRVAPGADPAPLMERALKIKKQLESLGYDPVFALSDNVSGKREFWVSVGKSSNPEDLRSLERRLERVSIGSEKPFQDAFVARVALPPR
jgi:hypothetical protein